MTSIAFAVHTGRFCWLLSRRGSLGHLLKRPISSLAESSVTVPAP